MLAVNGDAKMRNFIYFLFEMLLTISCFGGAQIVKLEPSGENLLKNGGFEDGLTHWTVPSRIKNSAFSIDRANFHEGGLASLKMEGRGGESGCVMQSVKIHSKTKKYRLSGWIKTSKFVDGWHATIAAECLFSEQGRTASKRFSVSSSGNQMEWARYEKEFEVAEITTWIKVTLESDCSCGKHEAEQSSLGICWFDSIRLEEIPMETKDAAIQNIIPAGEHGIFLPHQSPHFSLYIFNGYKEPKKMVLRIKIENFYNDLVFQNEKTIEMLDGPGIFNGDFSISSLEKTGFYSLKVTLMEKDCHISEDRSAFCVVAPPDSADPFFGLSGIGLNASFSKAARLMGVGTVGIIIPHKCAIEKGIYDWHGIDSQLEGYLTYGFRMIGFFLLSPFERRDPSWLRNKSAEKKKNGRHPFDQEYFDCWGDFVQQAVKRYHKEISNWSLAAEINWFTQDWEFDYYQKKVEMTYPAAKGIDPDCVIGGVGVTGSDWQHGNFKTARMMWPRIHAFLDGMFFDAYVGPCVYGPGHQPIGEEKGGLEDMLLAAKDIVAEYGKSKLAIDEKGYRIMRSLPVDSPCIKNAARDLSRGLIIAKSVSEVDRWLFFAAAGAPEGNFDYGLWKVRSDRKTLEPRPMAAAYATVAKLFAGARNARKIPLHKDIYAYVFERGSEIIGALWSVTEEPVSFLFDSPETLTLYDLMGNRVKELPKGKNELFLTSEPMFFTCNAFVSVMAKRLAASSYSFSSVKGALRIGSFRTLIVDVKNQTDQNLGVKTEIYLSGTGKLGGQKLNLKARECLPIIFDLGHRDLISYNKKELGVKIAEAGCAVDVKRYIDIHPILRVEGNRVDGDVSKYKGNPLVFAGGDFLVPIDALSDGRWTGNDDASCRVWLAYDDEHFYFAASVIDDQFIHEQAESKIWMNDGFKIVFDTMNDAVLNNLNGKKGYDPNDCIYRIALTPKGPQCWCDRAAEERKELQGMQMHFSLSIQRTDAATTTYEVAIPWSALGRLKPEQGAFGMNIEYWDCDASSTRPNYSLRLSGGVSGETDPLYFKTFIFMP
ncbi:MAG: sugar-binding protein [Verrucomicrobiae bacterium]|nr:sugar-binding protein [Verrucomicrobiae bacterium]